jgi:hypothetical protein
MRIEGHRQKSADLLWSMAVKASRVIGQRPQPAAAIG